MAKITKLSDYQDRALISHKHAEFQALAAHMARRIQDMREFVQDHNLTKIKSNHRVDCEVGRLCLMDIETLKTQLEGLLEEISIVESTADIIEFKGRMKKVA